MYITVFFASCAFLSTMYYVTDKYEMADAYSTKNIIKGCYLAVLFVFATILILPYSEYDNTLTKTFASLYVSNDFIGTLKVKLSKTTLCHHIVCMIMLVYTWNIDFNSDPVANMIFYLTYMSSMSFGVNLYLGLRKLIDVNWARPIVFYIYLFACCMNIFLQWYLYKPADYMACYLILLTFIVVDDIKLLKWLFQGI